MLIKPAQHIMTYAPRAYAYEPDAGTGLGLARIASAN
eukprot:gene21403-28363_t